MIIAVHRTGIDQVYGAGSWSKLEVPLRDYALSLPATGVQPTVLYVDAPGQSGLSGESSVSNGDGFGAARLVRAAALKRSIPPPAVLLVGGDEALAMCRFPRKTTVTGDSDADIPTDNPYGCLRSGPGVEVDPEVPVGRLAAGAGDGVDALIAQLQAARRDRPGRPCPSGAFVLTNTEWTAASQAVASEMTDAPAIFASSPQYAVSQAQSADLSRRVLFFNLHGTPSGSDWYGRNKAIAARPFEFEAAALDGSVVFACNCYGALITSRTAATSIALRCVRRGSSGFVGSTGFAFGALPPATYDFSEDLARRFMTSLGSGRPAGVSLWQARRDYVRARLTAGQLANRDYKTALQFVFFGDPLL